jgi:hypothetical protein
MKFFKALLFGLLIFLLVFALVFCGILVTCFINGVHVNQQILIMASIRGLKAGIVPGVVLPIILSLGGLRTRTPGGR